MVDEITDDDLRDLRNGGDWASDAYSELPWKAADEIVRLRAEVEELTAWKASASSVIEEWERVWRALGKPGQLGQSKALSSRVAAERLTAERDAALARLAPHEALVAELREWMGTSDRLMWSAPRLAENLLARHGFGGDA